MAVHSYGKQLFKCLNSKRSLVWLIYLIIIFCMQLDYNSMGQPIEAIMHSQHLVALEESSSDSWTDCSIHSRTRSSHIQYGDVDITLAKKYLQRYLIFIKNIYREISFFNEA